MKENKIIAEFMGLDYIDPNGIGLGSYLYNTSWDWLMPVVEKINSTGRFEVNIGYGHCYISDGEDKLTLSLQGKTTFDAIHKAIVEFIEWYNNKPCSRCNGEMRIKDYENGNKYSEDGKMPCPNCQE